MSHLKYILPVLILLTLSSCFDEYPDKDCSLSKINIIRIESHNAELSKSDVEILSHGEKLNFNLSSYKGPKMYSNRIELEDSLNNSSSLEIILFQKDTFKISNLVFDTTENFDMASRRYVCSLVQFDMDGETKESLTLKINYTKEEYAINKKWDSTEIASAALFLYIPEKAREENPAYSRRDNEIITSKGILNKYIIHSHTKELDSIGMIDLMNILTRDYYESFPVSACFEPHHGIIMKDIEGNVLGHVSICFQCDNYRIYPFRINAPMESFKELFLKNGFPIHRGAVYQLDNKE